MTAPRFLEFFAGVGLAPLLPRSSFQFRPIRFRDNSGLPYQACFPFYISAIHARLYLNKRNIALITAKFCK